MGELGWVGWYWTGWFSVGALFLVFVNFLGSEKRNIEMEMNMKGEWSMWSWRDKSEAKWDVWSRNGPNENITGRSRNGPKRSTSVQLLGGAWMYQSRLNSRRFWRPRRARKNMPSTIRIGLCKGKKRIRKSISEAGEGWRGFSWDLFYSSNLRDWKIGKLNLLLILLLFVGFFPHMMCWDVSLLLTFHSFYFKSKGKNYN